MATPEQPARAARALDDLYRRHAGEVFRYSYAVLGNRADAEDVTQATFVNALRALERGEQPRKPANWLLTIAHNLMRQRFRQERSRPTQVLLDGDLPTIAESEDAAPSVGELVGALGRIPVSQREAIVMREFEGRSYAEIAEILGVTTSALETLLFRARRSLAEELDNLVTCARAEQDVSRLLDGRLSRKERKRLQEHVRACPSCARFEAFQRKQRRALKGLALLPLPASLTLFKGAHGASAAGLPTIGTATAASGGSAVGGLALTGIATKAVGVVAAVAVAGGVGYEGATHVHVRSQHPSRAHGVTSSTPASGHAATTPGKRAGKTSRRGVAAHAVHPARSSGKKIASSAAQAHVQNRPVTSATTAPHGNAVGQSADASARRGAANGSSATAPGHTGTAHGNAGGVSSSHANAKPTTKKTPPGQSKTATPTPSGNGKPSGANGNANGATNSNKNAAGTTPEPTTTTPVDTSTATSTTGTSAGSGNGNGSGDANSHGANPNGNGGGNGNSK